VTARSRIVLVTGSAGLVGGVLARRLGDRYVLRGFDRRPGMLPGPVGDLTDPEALGAACRGVDAIVHLAADSRVDAPWATVLHDNIDGTAAVFAAARLEGVERIVFASSNHVVGQLEVEGAPAIYDGSGGRLVGVDEPFRPDSLYGVSKAFGETLGRYYSDRHGLRVVSLRIGTVVPDDDPWLEAKRIGGDPLANYRRLRATWLSHRDCAGLVVAALEADIQFAVVYGVSANPRRFWDLEQAERLLGFRPLDAAPEEPL
jgi:NAD+ dependent glucose-6-phosphate dehydrogenase